MDTEVKEVVDRIVAAYEPRKIILFGSRARNEAHAGSDIDLLVVYDGPLSRRQVQVGIHRLFPHPRVGMDVFVYDPNSFGTQSRIANTVAREAAEHGRVCHGS